MTTINAVSDGTIFRNSSMFRRKATSSSSSHESIRTTTPIPTTKTYFLTNSNGLQYRFPLKSSGMEFQTEVSGPPLTDTPPPSWIFDRLEEWTRRFPDRFAFALDRQDSVQEYRYADVLAQANGIAAGLVGNAIRP